MDDFVLLVLERAKGVPSKIKSNQDRNKLLEFFTFSGNRVPRFRNESNLCFMHALTHFLLQAKFFTARFMLDQLRTDRIKTSHSQFLYRLLLNSIKNATDQKSSPLILPCLEVRNLLQDEPPVGGWPGGVPPKDPGYKHTDPNDADDMLIRLLERIASSATHYFAVETTSTTTTEYVAFDDLKSDSRKKNAMTPEEKKSFLEALGNGVFRSEPDPHKKLQLVKPFFPQTDESILLTKTLSDIAEIETKLDDLKTEEKKKDFLSKVDLVWKHAGITNTISKAELPSGTKTYMTHDPPKLNPSSFVFLEQYRFLSSRTSVKQIVDDFQTKPNPGMRSSDQFVTIGQSTIHSFKSVPKYFLIKIREKDGGPGVLVDEDIFINKRSLKWIAALVRPNSNHYTVMFRDEKNVFTEWNDAGTYSTERTIKQAQAYASQKATLLMYEDQSNMDFPFDANDLFALESIIGSPL